MSTISVRVPDKELSIFEEYAKANNKSLSELIREIMIEQIEDEYDKKIFDEYGHHENITERYEKLIDWLKENLK